MQDVNRAVAAAEAGEPMRHRIARYAGGLPCRFGQREPEREPGRERGRVGAAGPVRGGHRVADDRDGQVSGAVEKVVDGVRAILTYPRVRLAANQAQRLAAYLAAAASIPNMPLLTLGLQFADVPDSFDNMHPRYRDTWRTAGPGAFEFPFFACPSCGHALHLQSGAGSDGADALICSTGDWRYDGWIGSKAQLGARPPALHSAGSQPRLDPLQNFLVFVLFTMEHL